MTRQKLIACVLALWSVGALGDTPPARVINSLTYDAASNAITSTVSGGKRGLDANVSNSLSAPANVGVVVSGALVDPRAIRALTTSDQVTAAQLGTWNITNVSGTVSLPTNAAQETGGNLAASLAQETAINGKMASFDLDSGAGVQNVQGVNLRLSASGGSVEAGTPANPLRIDPTGTSTQPVSTVSLPLPAGAATSALQTTGNSSLSSIDGKLNNTSGGALKVDGSAFTQPISAAALPLPAGAATSANQTTGNTSLSGINSKLFANGTSDATKVDGSSFTQPISGSVTANQGGSWTVTANQGGSWTASVTQSGTWNINNISGTISLPTGASTSANQTSEISAINSLSAKFGSLGAKNSSGSAPVVLAIDQAAIPVTQSGTWTMAQGTAAALAGAWPVFNTDGTNVAAVKGAVTAPTTSDPALVVAISPNSPISVTAAPPTNVVVTGNLTVACATGSGCSAGSTLQLAANGFTTFGYETHGTWSATLATDISFDTTCSSSPGTSVWYQTASIDTSTNDTSYLNVWGTSRNNHPWVLNIASASCARLRVVTYTSGTVNATISSSVGDSMVWAVNVGNVGSGAADAGNPIKVGAKYNLTPPTFADGNRVDLQANANGSLRVDGSGVTQPVSGTVTANQGGSWTATVTQATGTNLHTVVDSGTIAATQSGTWNLNNISGTVSLPTGAATSAKQPALGTAGSASADVLTVQGIASMTPLKTDGSATTQPVSGTVAATQSGAWSTGRTWTLASGTDSVAAVQSGTWTVQPGNTANTTPWLTTINQGGNSATVTAGNALKVDGSAVTQPISAASLPLPTGAATETTLAKLPVAQASTTSGQSGPLVQGAVTTAAPTYTTGQTDPLSLTTAGALRVDASATTQPVSGTVTANQGGAWTATVTQATGTNLHTVVDSGTVAATQSGTWNINNVSGTVSLPTGAATSALQTTGNTTLSTISGQLPATLGQKAAASALGVVTQADEAPATQNVTVQDTGSSSTTGANSQTIVTGSPTASSAATFSLSSWEGVEVQVTGTWTGTLANEVSMDGGTTWYSRGVKQAGLAQISTSFTGNYEGGLNVSGMTNFRVRATAAMTGTATIKVVQTSHDANIIVTNPILLKDPTTQSLFNTIKAASTAPLATDTALVTVQSPNGNQSTAALQTTGNTSLNSIDTKTPALGQTTQALSQPSIQPGDLTSTTGSITAQDTGSSTATQGNNQTIVTGSPTAGSTFSFNTLGYNSVIAKVSGTWTGSVQMEQSMDGGTSWIPIPTRQSGGSIFATAYTANVQVEGNVATKSQVRIRAVSSWTGTASVNMTLSYNNNGIVFVNNAVRITDGANSSVATPLTVLAASTAATTSNTSAVVALSPNSNSVRLNDGTNNQGGFANVSSAQVTSSTPGQTPFFLAMNMGWDGSTHREHTVDTSGNTAVVGNVAAGNADSGAAVKVGGVYNTSLPAYTNGQRGDFQVDQFGNLAVTTNIHASFRHQNTAATVTLKSGAGRLVRICLNTNGANGHTIQLWDNTAASGTVIALITTAAGSAVGACGQYDLYFTTGLTFTTSNTDDWTIVYE